MAGFLQVPPKRDVCEDKRWHHGMVWNGMEWYDVFWACHVAAAAF